MTKLGLGDVKDLVQYEKVREEVRARVIEHKKSRRVSVGPNLTVLFENRETVLFQVQEMVRTERIVQESKIQDELDAYNALLPEPGELSATLFIEIPELVTMTGEEVRLAVNRFQGLDRAVWLVVAGERVPARFEGGHSNEEKMAAVQYLRFALPQAVRSSLAAEEGEVTLVVAHPHYRAETTLPREVRRSLAADLSG
jgi:uncharacterized protein DUF3501